MTDLFTEAQPSSGRAPLEYGSAGDLVTVDDLLEMDLDVHRWKMKVRVRALDLDQEDRIETESLVKHPKTGEWYQPPALKIAITLREGIIVPRLDKEQAKTLVKRNPRVAEGIAQWIRLLSSLTHETIEKYIADTLRNDGAPLPVDEAGSGDTGLGANDSDA